MKKIILIGAGQLGSRHLQALKKVKFPLAIYVVDPNQESLELAKERYNSFGESGDSNRVIYQKNLDNLPAAIDLGIIATNSDVRFKVLDELLKRAKVRYLVLEKLLFQKKAEYRKALAVVKENKCKAWVNCSMRTMPFYYDLRKRFKGQRINYYVTGSQYGLVTNAIHYIDHVAFLTGCYSFRVETKYLDKKIIPSKRKGFLELNGNLIIDFKNRSLLNIACFSEGELPILIRIASKESSCIIYSLKNKAICTSKEIDWGWKNKKLKTPFQSEITTWLVEEILKNGRCSLVTLDRSIKTHLVLLESLRKFLNKHSGKKFNYYPFT